MKRTVTVDIAMTLIIVTAFISALLGQYVHQH